MDLLSDQGEEIGWVKHCLDVRICRSSSMVSSSLIKPTFRYGAIQFMGAGITMMSVTYACHFDWDLNSR